ncbi:MAG: bifunctional 5,10-methylenetetrahydrofolate dehydrogenase/5,10-methenyltetrahydrofolate cyclohydrolase [Bacilli bacterium]|nr:bifunctional 5,10-methylenetetrahydrofolate dehydrogenase/5,10-methenyltetrahydrofolate cyclohydrolase [Bacilli bacterium]MDD4808786.1 bifunctional 5,10-methylenetetrahydrofolate dehydrogenase/5,10-methenyltetrahydrofolate cyclohydrolase [Bacilli bacterium]
MDKDILGKNVSQKIKDEIHNYTNPLTIKPGLAVIQIGEHAASDVYINQKRKAALEVGITFKHFKFTKDDPEDLIIQKIKELNQNEYVSGIIVQLPIPINFDKNKIINSIDPSKDVDGLTSISLGNLVTKQDGFISCTPAGIMLLLNEYKIDVSRKHVVIIGRSELVGKPLMNLMLNHDATVTICHSKTINIDLLTKQADILIVAAGKPELIKSDMIKNSAIVIDVGINRVNGKIIGDVDYANVYDKVSYITPVPGGVGPMTVAMLLKNVMISHQKASHTYNHQEQPSEPTISLSNGQKYYITDKLVLDGKNYLYLLDQETKTDVKFCEFDEANNKLILVNNDDINAKLAFMIFEKYVS